MGEVRLAHLQEGPSIKRINRALTVSHGKSFEHKRKTLLHPNIWSWQPEFDGIWVQNNTDCSKHEC